MQQRPPTVSVIIATYNRARFLKEALDSVLAQTFSDFEVIVADDGSTDRTRELVTAVQDQRLRYHQLEHRGISATLNRGMSLARGSYVARLDSDDTWAPDMLEVLVPLLDEDRRLGFVYGRGRAMTECGQPINHVQGLPPRFPADPFASLLFDDCTCNVALLARRACLEEAGGYDESLVAHEDWDMWLRVTRYHPFRFVDRELASIRWHDGNLTGLTSCKLAEVLATRSAPLDRIYALADLPASAAGIRTAAYTNVHLYVAQRWLAAGDRGMAVQCLRNAVATSDAPITTLARALWLGLFVPRLRKTRFGTEIVQRIAEMRRRIREASHPR